MKQFIYLVLLIVCSAVVLKWFTGHSGNSVCKLSALGYTNVADFGGIISWPYETTTD